MIVRAAVPILGMVYTAENLEITEALVFWLALSLFSVTGLIDFGFTPTFIRHIAYARETIGEQDNDLPLRQTLSIQRSIYTVITRLI